MAHYRASMFEDLLLKIAHHWQYINKAELIRRTVTVVFTLDLMHSIYYVYGEATETRKAWREADEKIIINQVADFLHKAAGKCAAQHTESWPWHISREIGLPFSFDASLQKSAERQAKPLLPWEEYLSEFPSWEARKCSFPEASGRKIQSAAERLQQNESSKVQQGRQAPSGSTAATGVLPLDGVQAILNLVRSLWGSETAAGHSSEQSMTTSSNLANHVEAAGRTAASSLESIDTLASAQTSFTGSDENDLLAERSSIELGPNSQNLRSGDATKNSSDRVEAVELSSTESEMPAWKTDLSYRPTDTVTSTWKPLGWMQAESWKENFELQIEAFREYCRHRWPMPVASINRRSAMRFKIDFWGFSQPLPVVQDCCRDLSAL